MRILPDGRPINEHEIQRTLDEIQAIGVCGHHLSSMAAIFGAKENECQVALHITEVTWNRHVKGGGEINDPGLAILVRWFLLNPEEWPIKYRKEPDIEKIKTFLDGSIALPMLLGRSAHRMYSWSETAPRDHIKVLLNTLEEAIDLIALPNAEMKAKGQHILDTYFRIATNEGLRRGVDIKQAKSWGKNET